MKARHFYVIGFLLLATLDTLAQVSFKMAAGAAAPFAADIAWLARVLGEPWMYAALGCYASTFVVWMTLLTRAPIGQAYAASHLEVVSVLIFSHVVFNEPIAAPQIAGCTLIVLGIAFLAVGADQTRRTKVRVI